MSAHEALAANANAASAAPAAPPTPPSARPRKARTIQQEMLVREFVAAYDINPDQVSFDGESGPPFFYYEALAQIVTALTDFAELGASEPEIDVTNGHVTCSAFIKLRDERTVRSFGSSFIQEALPGGEVVETYQKGLDVSRARALRSALRMVGFDPVRAHEARKAGEKPAETRITPEDEQRNKELAEIHILAEQAGLIVGENKTAYYRQLSVFFPAANSSGELNAKERAQFIALLRGIKTARERAAE